MFMINFHSWYSLFRHFRYACEDPNCYFDLSRLRGLKYFTWEKKDKMTQEDEVCYFRGRSDEGKIR